MFDFFGTEMDFQFEGWLSFELENRCYTKKWKIVLASKFHINATETVF